MEKASILIKIIEKGNGFDHWGEARERPGMEKASILIKILQKNNGLERRGGSGAAGD